MDRGFTYRQNLRKEKLAARRRAAYLRRVRALAFLCTVAVLAVGTIAANVLITMAGDGFDDRQVKYYTEYIVESGDTVSEIAAAHMSSGYDSIDELVEEIRFINSLDEECTIRSGSMLILPYYSEQG